MTQTNDTLFGKIIRREIPARIVYEDEQVLGFHDIDPKAPTHVLFIPKAHIPTLNDATPQQAELLGRLLLAAAGYAREQGFATEKEHIVVTAGVPFNVTGTTNILRVAPCDERLIHRAEAE